MSDPIRRTIASHSLAAVGMSLPWPLLVLLVWERSGEGWELGMAGAARMLPYVALSWLAGRLADRFARDRIVRWTLVLRTLALLVVAASLADGQTWLAVAAATSAIAVATPAYPALAAALPGLAGRRGARATSLLVTGEVASFVVGPAIGGLLLMHQTRALVPWVAVACLVLAYWIFNGVRAPAPSGRTREARSTGMVGALRGSSVLRGAVAAVAVVNAVVAATALALLPVAQSWAGDGLDDATAFGLATGALGFGALGGPVLGWLGNRWRLGARAWCGILGGCLAGVAAVPSSWVALPLLALAGAAAVQVEIVATASVQTAAPDRLRATVLGLTDTAMVAAALLSALLTPALIGMIGGAGTVTVAAVTGFAGVLLVRTPARVPAEQDAPADEAFVAEAQAAAA